jgi:hypothetical protein
LGNHANSYEFTEDNFAEIEPLIRRAVYGGNISIIVSDGIPQIVNIPKDDISFEANANSSKKKESLINSRSTAVMNFLCYGTVDGENKDPQTALTNKQKLLANNAENNLLDAIREADTTPQSNKNDNLKKHIVIFDTGISTDGEINLSSTDLDFVNNEYDLDKYVEAAKNIPGAIPNLAGITIDFYKAATVEPQKTYPDSNTMVVDIWSKVFKMAGAEYEVKGLSKGTVANLSYDEGGVAPNGTYTFPHVSTVLFDKPIVDPSGTVIDIVIDRGTIDFIGNQSAVSNSQKANEVIELIAPILIDYLKTHPDKSIYLIGSVSSGAKDPKPLPMSDFNDELSNLHSLKQKQ